MNASHVVGNVAVTVTAVGLNSLWEDALVVACVWIFLRTWPRVNAATRYLIWSVALAAAAVVPVATTLPFLSMSPPAAATAAVKASVVPAMHAFPATAVPARVREAAAHGNAAHDGAAAPPALPRLHLQLPLVVAIVLASLWALLALAGAIRFGTGLLRLERLKRDALPLPVEYRDAMVRWNAATKGVRDVRLCVSDQIDVPVAVGLFDSMILIPRELLARLSADEVDQIVLHELAHLRRADDWTNVLTRILLAAFGWNPAVRFAAAQLDLEREVACDDYVLDASDVVRPYAMCLAKMAESSSWPRGPIAAPAVFATRKHLSLRIERLLFAGRAAGTNPSFGIAAFAVAGVVLLGCAIGSIAPSVAATVQPAALPPVLAHRVQTVHDIVRYVNVPRTVVAVATAVPSTHPVATTRPLTTMHVVATAHPFASLAPMTKPLRATVSSKPLATGTMAIHIPAIDVPSLHIAPIDVTIPKIGLANGGKTCTGCDYSGVDWRGRDVRGVAYTAVDLRRANLDGTDFSGGAFQGVDFSHARLRNASFKDARLTGCDFTGADLSGADFTGAHVSGCQFDHAQLVSARIRTIVTDCNGCDFAGANLGGVDLSNVRGANIDFAGADLSHASLSGSSFTNVDFAGAHMSGANIDGTVFTNCDLSGTNLTRAALARAKLIDTDYPDDR
ncbi:MAG: M56 family metallopeptidase [Candidatus Tumulicola sp.]